MTHLVERLSELSKHVDHLERLRSRVSSARDLERDLSLHNDLLFSLLTVCQLVIDISGELSVRRKLPFDDYTTAVRNLEQVGVPADLVDSLARLPGFRNVLLHDYVRLDSRPCRRAARRPGAAPSFHGARGGAGEAKRNRLLIPWRSGCFRIRGPLRSDRACRRRHTRLISPPPRTPVVGREEGFSSRNF
jgi:uncharacterized protein YutE (UPF0331/DUF86 family)